MKLRVLGCSGAIARQCRTTSFLLDHDILVDAGTGVGDLTLEEMACIDHVLLTHSHLDHIASLPLMVDAVASRRQAPIKIHALQATIDALKAHIFNGVIWPDFSVIPTTQKPFITFHPFSIGDSLNIADKSIEVLPAIHTVPAVGFAIIGKSDKNYWVFTGDTECNPALWEIVNKLPVGMLVIETAFSNRESDLAKRSLHLSPKALLTELQCIAPGKNYPICITHTKPAETACVMEEIRAFDFFLSHEIRLLQAGQEFQI